MIRLIGLFTLICLFALGGVWYADHPGSVRFVWLGREIEMAIVVLFAIVLALVVAVLLVYRIVRLIVGAPKSITSHRSAKHQKEGMRMMIGAFGAIAAGDPIKARSMARKAERLLENPSVSLLISAQTANREQDDEAAARAYTAMLEHQDTTFIGLRGLTEQALARGETAMALDYAERAWKLDPKAAWCLKTLVSLYARSGENERLERMMKAAVRHGAMSQPEARSARGAYYTRRAQQLLANGETDNSTARHYAERAMRLNPENAIGALTLAQCRMAENLPHKAIKVVLRGWRHTPHPDLAALLERAVMRLSPARQQKVFDKLIATNPDAVESYLYAAKIAIRHESWEKARDYLTRAAAKRETVLLCQLTAELEEKEGQNSVAAQSWLKKAGTAHPGSGWVCRACNEQNAGWDTHCAHCGGFNTLRWRALRPVVTADAGKEPAGLLIEQAPTMIQDTHTSAESESGRPNPDA